jgi:hypothetical protein
MCHIKEATMFAIKEIQDIQAGIVTIRLPDNFPSSRAEIIVLPVEESSARTSELQELLLHAPTLSDEELQSFEEVREWMNQWTIKEC